MKLEKAIEILTLMGKPEFEGHTEDILAARQLGIEALIFLEKIPVLPIRPGRELLPSETP